MGVDEIAEMSEDKLVESAVFKMDGLKSFFDIISHLVKQRRYKDLYYLLRCMKLMGELLQLLMLTSEERKVTDKAVRKFARTFVESVKPRERIESK